MKRWLLIPVLVLALAVMATAAIFLWPKSEPTSAGPSLTGDVNCDGVVNAIDAALTLQLDVGFSSSLPCPADADVNGDGTIDAVDVALMRQFDAGVIATFPPASAGTSAASGKVAVGSTTIAPGGQGSVEVEALGVTAPGLGAWTIDVTYDPSVIAVVSCTGHVAGFCNPNFGPSTVRTNGAVAAGLPGNTTLATITFQCGPNGGSSPLTLSINTFADATPGGPLPIEAVVNEGIIDCEEVPEVPTATPTVAGIEVPIDIKPGSDPNVINPTSQDGIPVGILSTADFDARSEINLASLTFGRTGDEDSLAFCSPGPEDVNGDGLLDEVCKFSAKQTGFQCNDTRGVLRGNTVDGVPLEGRDSVRISPSACPGPTATATGTPVPGATSKPTGTPVPGATSKPTGTPPPTGTTTQTPAAAPPNDDFAASIVIPEPLPFSNKQGTSTATLQLGEPQPCVGIAPTVWYSFTPSTNVTLIADTEGSSYDTALAVYTGTGLGTLSTLGCNDDFFGLQSRVQFTASGGETYHFQVGGFFGSSGNLVFNLTAVIPTPTPTITPTPTPCPPEGCPTPTPTATAGPFDGQMSLNVKGGICDDPNEPSECIVAPGSQFTLSVDVDPPAAGFIGIQTWVEYGGLDYKPTASAADEIVWTDGVLPLRIQADTHVGHADLTSLFPPFPASNYTGNFLEISLNCTAGNSVQQVELIPLGTDPADAQGAGFKLPDRSDLPAKADSLTINCAPLSAGADSDSDGCTNEQEAGPDEQSGGRRNFLRPWDFYDINGDRTIDLFGDIFAVAFAFGTAGNDDLDRSAPPTAAEEPDPTKRQAWDMGPPDGVIDLFNDLFGVAFQFGHNCN